MSLVGLVVLVGPILSIVGFLRGRATRRRLDELAQEIEALRAHVATLSPAPGAVPRPSPRPQPEPGAAAPLGVAPEPVIPTPASPVAPRAATVPVPPPALAPPPLPMAPSAGSGASADDSHEVPPPPPPPFAPGATPTAPEPPAAPPSGPAFDWESLLGVRGAAWLGGITLVIAALFFAKWSIDQGFFSPVIRVATMLVAGTAALVWAEVKLRGGYQTTANAVSGAGIVILYVAFFAGHSLYQLFTLSVAFAGMSVVTLLAAVIAIRFDAQFTALIGIAGGLATPVLLSSDVDRPVAFFSYLAVLAAGFLHVAERRTWPSVTAVALVGTAMLELGWYANRIAPATLPVGASAFAVLGGIFLWHAVRTRERDRPLMHQAALTGAMVPLGFAILLAAESRFADQWAVVATFLAVVDLALVTAALAWGLPVLVAASALASAMVSAILGDFNRLVRVSSWGLPLVVIALAAAYSQVPRLAARVAPGWLTGARRESMVAATAAFAGVLAFAGLATSGGHLPLWAFAALVATALAIAVDRTHEGPPSGAFVLAAAAVTWTCYHWVVTVGTPETYADHLTLPTLVAIAVAIVSGWRSLRSTAPGSVDAWRTDHAAALVAVFIAYAAALEGLPHGAGRTPVPMFLLVGLDVALMLLVVAQTGWASIVPAAALAAVVFEAAWHIRAFNESRAFVGLTAYTVTYAVFLAWPFAAARVLSSSWKARPAPWLASALIGPALFLLYYDAWRRLWGTAIVGVVPVAMAAISVAALYGISRNFVVSDDTAEGRRRLNYLALFSAITLGFIATAVPLQLERQWITIGWALQAAAVWWLFGLLPHPGLKYFGLGLYLAVGTRLLANPEVLRYEPRGAPILNWLLYTYGVPAICCVAGTWLFRRAERRRGPVPEHDVVVRDREVPGPLVGFIGVLLVFWLINLQIADYYSAGRYVELDFSRHLARDLTRSCAWGLYALALLGAGLWRANRGLRLVSLGFLLLTVAKVFLYDLDQLTGLYRIMSFLALGVSLIAVSLLYQRFVRPTEAPA